MALKAGAMECQLRVYFGTYGGGYDGVVFSTGFCQGRITGFVEGILQDYVRVTIGRAQGTFNTSGFSYADKVHPACGYITIVQEGEAHVYVVDKAYTGGDANTYYMEFNAAKPRIS